MERPEHRAVWRLYDEGAMDDVRTWIDAGVIMLKAVCATDPVELTPPEARAVSEALRERAEMVELEDEEPRESLTFDLTVEREDYTAFLKDMIQHEQKSIRLPLWGSVGLIGVMVAILLFVPSFHWPTALGFLGLFGLVAFVLGPRARRAYQPSDDGLILGRARVVLDDRGVHAHRPAGDTLVRWPTVQGLRETDDHFFLMVDRIAAVILPKRDLPRQEDVVAIRDYVAAHTA